MTRKNMYRYLGRNGTLTTKILIDGATYIPLFELVADNGKILTDGTKTAYSIIVEEDEVSNWKEIADKTN